jgi:hypothetical protein
MLVFEFKAYGKSSQFTAVDEAISTAQFVRNSCLRYWNVLRVYTFSFVLMLTVRKT